MTESKPDQSAPPEHTGGEPATTTQPVSPEAEVTVSGTGSSTASSTGSSKGSGSNGEHTAASNGHQDDVSPRLPPPWERVPSTPVGGESGSGSGSGPGIGNGAKSDPAEPWSSADTVHHGTGSGTDPDEGLRSGTEHRPDVERGAVPGTPIGRGVADLGDARTIGLESRAGIGTGIGGLGGGFGLGTSAGGSSTGASSTGASSTGASSGGSGIPGGFPAAWPRNRRPRQANLQLKRLDPWSVLKIALVLSVVLYLVWMVAVGVLYGALDGIGVWERLNGQYSDLVAEHAGDRLISAGRIFGFAAVVGAVNSLLVAVAFSVSAFIYNVSADMVGGIEVTLSERD